MGLQNAAAIIDVTDPYNPYEIDRISGGNSIWRDLKYWDRHVYIGTEADDGIKIVSVDNLDSPQLINTITDVEKILQSSNYNDPVSIELINDDNITERFNFR